jgi:hypothetical protein
MSAKNRNATRIRYALKKVKNFLRRVKSKELLTFLFFICLSSLFWLMQSMNEESETSYRIPIRYCNVPDDVVLTPTPVGHLTVRLRDKGIVLLDYSFRHKFHTIDIDLAPYFGSAGGTIHIKEDFLTSVVKRQLKATTMLATIVPDTLSIGYSHLGDKWVSVRFDGLALPAEQFRLAGDISIEPDSVQVFAPHTVLDTLSYISTRFSSLTELTATVSKSIELSVPSGAKVVPSSVTLTVPVEEYTEKRLTLPISVVGVPDSLQLRLFPSVAEVSFFCSVGDFSTISADAFRAEVNFAERSQGSRRATHLGVELVEMPINVSNVRLQPDSVEYLIEVKDLR